MKKQTRAISAEQKQERRDHILDTARGLLLTHSYEEIQMIDIAKAAGLAKGTLYLYFKTKEELFLVILQEAYKTWFADLDRRLISAKPCLSVNTLVDLFSEILAQHPIWMKLVPISHTILEHNILISAALEFKQQLSIGLSHAGNRLEACCAFIPQGKGAALLLEIYAILIGVLSLAEPAPVVKRLIQTEPSLAAFQINHINMFSDILTNTLIGAETLFKGANK